ncbi:MAG: hypothetical protein DCC57_03275 [Chloroflexi bacterium]|nr:MAG: hypothetical protein DCC57_03275 [Chloroflexota bacterium]
MSWEIVCLATAEYESRLRRAEEARLAREARRLYAHPAPQTLQHLRGRLGHRLVAWGMALQTPADRALHDMTAMQPK